MAYRKGLLEFRCVAGAFSRVLHQRQRGLVVDPVFLEHDDDCQREKTEPDAARPPPDPRRLAITLGEQGWIETNASGGDSSGLYTISKKL